MKPVQEYKGFKVGQRISAIPHTIGECAVIQAGTGTIVGIDPDEEPIPFEVAFDGRDDLHCGSSGDGKIVNRYFMAPGTFVAQTADTDVTRILLGAKGLLSNRRRWVKNRSYDKRHGGYDLIGALYYATKRSAYLSLDSDAYEEARQLIFQEAHARGFSSPATFNDAKETNFSVIANVLDSAIERSRIAVATTK